MYASYYSPDKEHNTNYYIVFEICLTRFHDSRGNEYIILRLNQ